MPPAQHEDLDESERRKPPSESALAESIVRNFTDALVVVDRDWRILFASRASERPLPARTLWELWPEIQGSALAGEYERAWAAKSPAPFEHRRPGPPETWWEVTAFPCEAGLALCYRDITGRKLLESERWTREQELTEYFDEAGIGLATVEPDGSIRHANNAELRLLGYSLEEYAGRNIRDFHVDPALANGIVDRLQRREDVHSREARLQCRDGSIRHVVITARGHWREGRFEHATYFTRDVSDRALADAIGRRLAAIVESSEDAIISKNLQGIIQSWNRGAERIFGYVASEVIGQHISILAVPERVDEIPNILDRITRGERVEHYVTQRRAKDGRKLWVSLTVSPVRDAEGRIVGASKVARDVTDAERSQEALREINEQLRRANMDLQQFAFSAAHDLQEPLRMVSLFTQLLQRKYRTQFGPDADEYMTQTVAAANRMNRLLSDLLTYTEVSSANLDLANVADPNQAVRAATSNLEAAMAESGATVLCEELPLVKVRPVDLEQLFQNLIGNAIKYRKQDPPSITIGAKRRGRDWVFSVTDNGIGIDPQYGEQIFGLFKRLHTATEYPGTGLGLAICQRIVERAGGRIWVESEPGTGSTFSFTFPVIES